MRLQHGMHAAKFTLGEFIHELIQLPVQRSVFEQ